MTPTHIQFKRQYDKFTASSWRFHRVHKIGIVRELPGAPCVALGLAVAQRIANDAARELWPSQSCCAFAVLRRAATETPSTCQALPRSVIPATAYADMTENHEDIATLIAGPQYLDQPQAVVQQVLTGTYPSGLGGTRGAPDRIRFDPFPIRRA